MQAAGHKSNLSNALIQPSKSQFVCKHFKVSSALFLCSFGHHSCEVGWEFSPSFYGRGILGSVRRSAADRPMMTLRPPLEVSAHFPAPLPAPTGASGRTQGSGFMELCKMIGTHRRNGRVVSGLRRAGPGRRHTWNTLHVLSHNETSSTWLSKDLRTREDTPKAKMDGDRLTFTQKQEQSPPTPTSPAESEECHQAAWQLLSAYSC
ncbi:hypothetical protein H8959_016328 [Pygathrix nigripes]